MLNFALMNYSFYLARKLSLGRSGSRISPAVIVAIISVALSIAVMIASIAIVLGFKQEIRDKVVGFNGDISIYRLPNSEADNNLITLTPWLTEVLDSLPYVKEYNLQAAIPAILKTEDNFKGVYLRGVKGKLSGEYLKNNLLEGEVPDFEKEEEKNKIVISKIAADQLNLNIGDKIDTYFISDDIKVRRLNIVGIYNSHFEQYDDVLIFGSLALVSQLGKLPEESGTSIVVRTLDFDKIPEHTYDLQYIFNKAIASGEISDFYRTDNVLNQGRGYFSWLSLLDTNVVVIIILMMVVGCVTLISGMLIIILERKKFIGLMRALGTSTAKIREVFIYMAVRVAAIGMLIGDFFILIFLYCQQKYHFLPLDADSYYIDFVPVFLPGWIVLALNAGVLLVIYLILVLPSRFVGKISPAETLIKSE